MKDASFQWRSLSQYNGSKIGYWHPERDRLDYCLVVVSNPSQ